MSSGVPTRLRPGATAVKLLLAILTTALTLFALPGTASAATAAPRNHVTHPLLDWIGSTVRAHEGGSTVSVGQGSSAVSVGQGSSAVSVGQGGSAVSVGQGGSAAGQQLVPLTTQTPGMDVSGYQGSVDWTTAWNNGARFAYVKATESTTYINPDFAQQYNGSYNVGMIRGAYHFATPDTSSGTAQADYFVAHGGGWSADGQTLPPVLDIEYNPYGATCYNLSQSGMISWISDFTSEVASLTGRYPVIYTTTDWWTTCTGNTSDFAANDPLWIARYSSSVGTLPSGWSSQTFWQYADSGTFPGDQDYFNGTTDQLSSFALG